MSNIKEKETTRGIYNLSEFCRDMDITQADFCKEINISHNTYHNYIHNNILVETAEKINEYVESIVDDPEKYLLTRMPFVAARGRKLGSKNKSSSVKTIPVQEYLKTKNENIFQYKERNTSKIYLNNEEEIFEALKNGEVVFNEGDGYNFRMLRDDNACLLLKSRGATPIFFNSAMDLEGRYYILQKDPLKLEVGKTYINKNNSKVTIYAFSDDGTFKGIEIGKDRIQSYASDGICLNTAENNEKENLMEEVA